MAIRIWAVDLRGGQGIIYDDTGHWYLSSIDTSWIPQKIDGEDDAIRWARNLAVTEMLGEFTELEGAAEAVRRASLLSMSTPGTRLSDVRHLVNTVATRVGASTRQAIDVSVSSSGPRDRQPRSL